MENRVYSRPLAREAKQHGSSNLQRLRQMAKEASLKKDDKEEKEEKEENNNDDE